MKHSSFSCGISCRHFLATTGTAIAMPTIIPISALGKGERLAPSERISIGVIGRMKRSKSESLSNKRSWSALIVALVLVVWGHTAVGTETARPGAIREGTPTSWTFPARCEFGRPGRLPLVALSGTGGFVGLPSETPTGPGSWREVRGLLLQTDASHPNTLLVAPNASVERCRARTRLKVDTDRLGAEAGLAVHVESPNTYVLVSIRRGKAAWYAVLTRWGPYEFTVEPDLVVGFGRLPGDLARLPNDAGQRWHTIDVITDGGHVRATVDGKITLAYSFALIDGQPITVGDQAKDSRLASNWGPKVFQLGGQVGLATRNAAARFDAFEVENLPAGTTVHTPLNPAYDVNGRVQPRWSYAWVMKNYTEWFLSSRQLVTSVGGNRKAADADLGAVMDRTGWPPYFFSWATSLDDMGLDDLTQFPTHNAPPTISGFLQYYLFSGDERFIAPARQWADWLTDEFSTPADFAYPYLPKSTYAYLGRGYTGKMLELIELDKASYVGLAYLDLYAVAGDGKYLQAARRIADSLKPHQRADGSLPFRINLKTGEVTGAYTCSQLWHARFFSSLGDLTGCEQYRQTGERALQWLLVNPVKNNQWWGFYGDVSDPQEGGSTYEEWAARQPEGLLDVSKQGEPSYDQWVALETAQWLCDHHEQSPEYLDAARRILSYIEKRFVRVGGVHKGVPAIGEQTVWPAILPHHNMRLAETYARLYGATGDPEAKELAIRIANSMTQMVTSDGKFHHGLNSGIDHMTALLLSFNMQFSRLMAEIPETAPRGENHLLHSSGYVRHVRYGARRVAYETLGATQDILVIKSRPKRIAVNGKTLPRISQPPRSRVDTTPAGWVYEADTGRLIILHDRGTVDAFL